MKNALILALLIPFSLFAQKEIAVELIQEQFDESELVKITSVKIKSEHIIVVKFSYIGTKKDEIKASWSGAMLRSLPPIAHINLYHITISDTQKRVNRKIKLNLYEIYKNQLDYGVKIVLNGNMEQIFLKGALKVEPN